MRELAAYSVLAIFLQACCGCPQPAETPDGVETPPLVEEAPPPEPRPVAEPVPEAAAAPPPKAEPKPQPPPVAEPQFSDGMSVADAIKVVPMGSERANIDQETLGKPLQDFALYEPCKPGSVHFKIKIAVWDGKVVGTDVTTTPKNDKVTACIKGRLNTLSWQAKVKSLNTVEYSF